MDSLSLGNSKDSVDGTTSIELSDIYFTFLSTYFVGFASSFVFLFRSKLLYPINGTILLTSVGLFLYYLGTRAGYQNGLSILTYAFVGVVIFSLFKKHLPVVMRGIFYILYLVVTMTTTFVYLFQVSRHANVDDFGGITTIFLTGSVALYAMSYFVHLIQFIPYSSSGQNRSREIKEYFIVLSEQYGKLRISPLVVILVSVLYFSILVLNYVYKFTDENLLAVVSLFLITRMKPRREETLVN